MPTARLADRQTRAAADAAHGLDVRPPVSEALARTGLVVSPAMATAPAAGPADGLPADERCVHGSTLDALAQMNATRLEPGVLTDAEASRLGGLDLAAIDGELERLTHEDTVASAFATWGGVLAVVAAGIMGVISAGLALTGESGAALFAGAAAAAALLLSAFSFRAQGAAPNGPRRDIYLVLRERALAAASPWPTSSSTASPTRRAPLAPAPTARTRS